MGAARHPAADASVFVAVPAYGGLVPQAVESLIQPSEHARFTVKAFAASLLAHCFNTLWCSALNSRKECGWTHFAMMHSDQEAEGRWLDKLLAERERVGADVLSVVLPIKDPRGLTSTGVMRPDGTLRRLTMREVYALPETFGVADVPWAGPDDLLAVNTGLWVCDFTRPWCEEVCFNVADAVKRREDGSFVARVLPEDWGFSRWAHDRGLRVRATRCVAVRHHGAAAFPNTEPWGSWDFDRGDEPGVA